MKKGTQKKSLILVLALMMLVAVAVGGTIAYLLDVSDEVVNTFKPSNIEVELEETVENEFQIIPGVDLDKDPKVTVTNDVDCYVFVEVAESAKFNKDVLNYTIAQGWIKLEDGVYYREVGKDDTTKTFSVIEGDKVYVSTDVDMDDMTALGGNVTLTFTAYAIQQATFANAAAAWAEVK